MMEKKSFFRSIVTDFVHNNIFGFRKGDGVAYFFFYACVPVVVTWLSLKTLPVNAVASIYCYTSILISGLNCLYDAGNRWESGKRSFKNTKIAIMMICTAIPAVYCFCEIYFFAVHPDNVWQGDWVLFAYWVVVIIAIIDMSGCFANEMAWGTCAKAALKQGEES